MGGEGRASQYEYGENTIQLATITLTYFLHIGYSNLIKKNFFAFCLCKKMVNFKSPLRYQDMIDIRYQHEV